MSLLTESPNRTQAPEAFALTDVQLFEPELLKLANGVSLFYIDRGEAELIRLEVIFRLNKWDSTNPILSNAAIRLIAEGTSTKTSAQIAGEIDFYGSFFQVNQLADYAVLTLYSLRKYLDNSISILKEILVDAVYPVRELETYRQNAIQRLKIDEEKTNYLASRKFHSLLFGQNHPYGYSENEADYALLNRENLRDHYEKHLSHENAFIILSGKVKSEDIETVSKILGSEPWRKAPINSTGFPEITLGKEKNCFIERKDSLQSSIRIGKPMFTKTHPDYAGMQILSTVLGGYFGSRLMANIREDKGYTYGIHSGLSSHRDAGFFSISTDVGAQYTNETVSEIHKEVKRLREEEISEEEISLVCNYMIGSFQGSLENAFSYADKFKSVLFFNQDYTYYKNYFDTVKSIKPAKLMELANEYLEEESFYTVIAGKKG